MKTIRLIPALTIGLMLAVATVASAQVKIGSNPTTITTDANLDVEGNNNAHMVVLKSGNVGIRTQTPSASLDVRGTTKVLPDTGVQTGDIWNGTSNMNGFEVTTRSGGDAFVGIQRTNGFSANLHLGKAAGAVVNSAFLAYYVDGVNVGSITYNGTGSSYNQISDQRLKENVHTSKFGLETLKGVKIYDYNFKSDKSKALSTGVLAQELHKVYPQAVTVGGADAKTNPWQVDYSKLVPVLIKSVQELSQEVESLKSEKAQLSAELNERVSQIERLLGTQENAKSGSSFSSSPSSVSK